MNRVLFFILVIIVLIGCQSIDTNQQKKDNRFVIGQADSLKSEILGEFRKIWVYIPNSTKTTNSPTKYPVIYLLDGSHFFHSVTGMIENLGMTKVIPQMAVIAIQNTNRGRDLTPTPMDVSIWTGDSLKTSGGGERFMNFIEHELIPYVENKYSVSNYRTLIGHSLGGLTVINTVVNRSYLFDNYIAIEPSLWWDNQYLLKVSDTSLNKPIYSGKSLFVGIANTIPPDFDINKLQSDTAKNTLQLRSIMRFVNATEKKTKNGLHFGWKYYVNDDHGSAAFITEYDALRFMFPWYKLRLPEKYYSQPYSKEYADELINLITSHYDTISYHFGYKVMPPELTIKHLGQGLLYFWQQPEYSLVLFALNIKNYPNSVNAYETMGDYYLIQSDTTKAIEFFSKAVEIGDEETSKGSVEKLNKLKLKN
jgi:predicted alpha/beta superfamily hydrolase